LADEEELMRNFWYLSGVIALFSIALPMGTFASDRPCYDAEVAALKNLRRPLPADYFDQQLDEAAHAALYDEKYDVSKAPGSWYEMKSGAYAGKKIHYVELDHETTGPSKGTFVLVGGLRYHAEQWNETQFVDTLRKRGYKVVVVDVPGQGWTHLRELAENGSKPGNIRVPLRYDKEDQAQVVQELLTSLRENNRIGENTHLVGISYGLCRSLIISSNRSRFLIRGWAIRLISLPESTTGTRRETKP
jgi:hypothetical protein